MTEDVEAWLFLLNRVSLNQTRDNILGLWAVFYTNQRLFGFDYQPLLQRKK